MKSQIIEQLGQADILLPSLVAEGLAANDRIKVRMSALQAASQHAQQPDRPATDLHVECNAAGLAPAALAGAAEIRCQACASGSTPSAARRNAASNGAG